MQPCTCQHPYTRMYWTYRHIYTSPLSWANAFFFSRVPMNLSPSLWPPFSLFHFYGFSGASNLLGWGPCWMQWPRQPFLWCQQWARSWGWLAVGAEGRQAISELASAAPGCDTGWLVPLALSGLGMLATRRHLVVLWWRTSHHTARLQRALGCSWAETTLVQVVGRKNGDICSELGTLSYNPRS